MLHWWQRYPLTHCSQPVGPGQCAWSWSMWSISIDPQAPHCGNRTPCFARTAFTVVPCACAARHGLQRTVMNRLPRPVRENMSVCIQSLQSRHQRLPWFAATHSMQVGDFCRPPENSHDARVCLHDTHRLGGRPRAVEARRAWDVTHTFTNPIAEPGRGVNRAFS